MNALTKAQFNHKDSSTNRLTVHPHVLRKFFRTRLGAVIPTDVVEFLMGHEGYLTKEYRKYEVEELAQFYKKGESALTVLGGSEESVVLVNGLIDDVASLKQQIEELKTDYSNLETAFNKSVNELAVDIKELKDALFDNEKRQKLKEKIVLEEDEDERNIERERDYDRIERARALPI
ncbi:hypothetical protein MUP77_02060 [Candidatus Bathyarchaeota archaeon]|nr:hypothetical protein [Candidatus Bathyarchaeota archaeon]